MDELSLEVTFSAADDLAVNSAASAAASRQIVNSRIDTALQRFHSSNNVKRTGSKSGAFQSMITFEHIKKNADGLTRCREIAMSVIDAMERN